MIFLTGGFSHVDTFDYKPALNRYHGKPVPSFGLRSDETGNRPLLGSPFRFRQCGAVGPEDQRAVSQPGDAGRRAVRDPQRCTPTSSSISRRCWRCTPARRPCRCPRLGAWLSYGLGTFNPTLPSYMVLCEHMPYAGTQVWDSSFLPPIHQGVRIVPGPEPIPDLRPPAQSVTLRELERMMLRDVNERHAACTSGRRRPSRPDRHVRRRPRHDARGARGARHRPRDATRRSTSYGITAGDTTSFGYQCLIARRLIERGVRVVELIDTGSNNNWDAHGNMQDHRPKALRVDRAIAALLKDLKAARAVRPDAGGHLHRVRPDALDRCSRNQGPQPLRQGVHGLARGRRRQGGLRVRRDRRVRHQHRRRTRCTSTTTTRRSCT